MPNVVGQKGQVVISKKIRDELGVEPGSMTVQIVVNGHLEIHFFPPEHNRSLMGCLKDYIDPGVVEGLSWEEIRRLAWEAAALERVEGWEQQSHGK